MADNNVNGTNRENIDKTFGERLLQLRTERQLSMEEVGKVIGVGKSAINKYEKHMTEPRMREANALAKFFGVSIDWLIGITDIRDYEDETYLALFRSLSSQSKEDAVRYMQFLKTQEI